MSDRDKILADADEQRSPTRPESSPSLNNPVQNPAVLSEAGTSMPGYAGEVVVESFASPSSAEITPENSPEPSNPELVVTTPVLVSGSQGGIIRTSGAEHELDVRGLSPRDAALAADKAYEEALKTGASKLIIEVNLNRKVRLGILKLLTDKWVFFFRYSS